MLYKRSDTWRNLDWWTVLMYLVLVVAGWFTICGASYDFESGVFFAATGRPASQLMWIGVSLAAAFIILMLDRDFFEVYSYLIYGAVMVLLVATIFLAGDIKGSGSWLVIGPIRLQPAEFAKFATALALARTLSVYGFRVTRFKDFMTVAGLILLPMIAIILQREAGSALVFLAFFLVLYREEMPGYLLFAGICMVAFFVLEIKFSGAMLWETTPEGEFWVTLLILVIETVLVILAQRNAVAARIILLVIGLSFLAGGLVQYFIPGTINFVWICLTLILGLFIYLSILALRKRMLQFFVLGLCGLLAVGYLYSVDYVFDEILEPHQQTRIRVALGMEDDPSGAGYNVDQSLVAIGSGGFSGKGFLNGTQTKLSYVPEQETDFIFCTVGEEFGFIGTSLVLLLFTALILRLFIIAERQPNIFGRAYGYAVGSIFLFHVMVNIGMVIGLIPVIGIPLPFFSYGGSSLLGFTILLFILLQLDANRKSR